MSDIGTMLPASGQWALWSEGSSLYENDTARAEPVMFFVGAGPMMYAFTRRDFSRNPLVRACSGRRVLDSPILGEGKEERNNLLVNELLPFILTKSCEAGDCFHLDLLEIKEQRDLVRVTIHHTRTCQEERRLKDGN